LSGDQRVKDETRLRVIAAAKKLSYTPNATAQSLIRRRSNIVGVVVSDITNPFYPVLVESLDRMFAGSGYRLILFNGHGTDERADALRHLSSRLVDGLVFTSALLDYPFADELAALNAPVVFVNRYIDDPRFDRVVADNVGGGAHAARLLVEQFGHERIAVISGPSTASTARDRERGFRGFLEEIGRALDESLYCSGPFTRDTGVTCCQKLLSREERPSAIFCGNDIIALGAWDAAVSSGVSVPGELSILGFDDIPIASWSAIGLTTVRQPVASMAQAAAEMLIERIEGSAASSGRTNVFPTELILRRTVGLPSRLRVGAS